VWFQASAGAAAAARCCCCSLLLLLLLLLPLHVLELSHYLVQSLFSDGLVRAHVAMLL